MALNVTIDGFVYKEDNSLSASDVSYQAYFYKANSGSSNSKWNNTRVVEATGYYSVNLGDGDWLTQDGSASNGDVIIIVFWSPASSDRMDTCSSLVEWSCFRIVLDGSSTYTTQVQVKSNYCPNLNWALQGTGLVDHNITAANNSSDQHQWDFMGTNMYQRNTWYTTLMTANSVNNSDYDWGDSHQDNNQPGTTNGTHSWSASGDYDVELVIEDECGCTVTGTDSIRIYNNPPVPNIIMIPADPDPNEPVSFRYTGTDVDNTISSIAWVVGDSGSYGNTNTLADVGRDDTVPHTSGIGTDWCGQSATSGAFTNPGSHNVSILISWWDGFDTQTMNYSEAYNQRRFTGPSVSFNQVPAQAIMASGVKFVNTSTSTSRVGLGLPDCTEYDWTWTDDTITNSETDKPHSYELERIPTTVACLVKLCASWSDGWETRYSCYEKAVVFETTVSISTEDCYYILDLIGTSDDGSISDYSWTIASGTTEVGPWVDIWNSPVNIDQNHKKLCFTSEGWYKIDGYIYGTGATTTDDEIIYITEVCPTASGIEVAVCEPDIVGHEIGKMSITVNEVLKPHMRGSYDIKPCVSTINTFPGPRNI